MGDAQQQPQVPDPAEALARATVRRSAVLPAPPERVWKALTDDDELSAWFGGAARLDPRPGGTGTFVSAEGRRTARVKRAEPGRRLTWRWWPAGDADDASGDDPNGDDSRGDESGNAPGGDDRDGIDGASEVDLVLAPVPGGTRIEVTETPVGPAASVQWALRLEVLAQIGAPAGACHCVAVG